MTIADLSAEVDALRRTMTQKQAYIGTWHDAVRKKEDDGVFSLEQAQHLALQNGLNDSEASLQALLLADTIDQEEYEKRIDYLVHWHPERLIDPPLGVKRPQVPKVSKKHQVWQLIMFWIGLVGIMHEVLMEHAQRPTMLILFAVIMGFPAFVRKDTYKEPLPELKTELRQKYQEPEMSYIGHYGYQSPRGGRVPRAVIQTRTKEQTKAIEDVIKSIKQSYAGPTKTGKMMVLSDGLAEIHATKLAEVRAQLQQEDDSLAPGAVEDMKVYG